FNKVAQMYSTIQTGASQGMQTLDHALQQLVQQGVVSMEEAGRRAGTKH
ncbi:twitching motility protein PilT, partial [Halorhodospira sp. M39old]|nr:twitching motility protein PilT [Halorhodospira sp. M39old]